jgi:hypothetical protein
MKAAQGTAAKVYCCLSFRFGLMTSVIFSTESLASNVRIASSSFSFSHFSSSWSLYACATDRGVV